jgi:TRAP-type C4-dicarboxylate transport system permease small subunit
MVARLVEGYFRLLRFAIAGCLAVMVVLVFGNVVLRYGFNSGITVSEELSRWLFVWMVFLGAIVAMRRRAHLGMDSIVERLPEAGKKACFAVSHLLMLLCVWLVLKGSWQQTLINLDVRAPATGLSSGLFYGIGIVFAVSAAAILLGNLYRLFTGRIGAEELIQVKESEEETDLNALEREITRKIRA